MDLGMVWVGYVIYTYIHWIIVLVLNRGLCLVIGWFGWLVSVIEWIDLVGLVLDINLYQSLHIK